jgi:hypothetical protein
MRTTVLFSPGHHVSFNFNKLRAMVAARVLVGIQLERIRLSFPGRDKGDNRHLNK